MQTVLLTFYKRVILWNSLGNHQAQNLKQADMYLRIMAKVRLTDEETRESKFLVGQQGISWLLPSLNYGDKRVELEDTEAEGLASACDNFSPVKVLDGEWLLELKTQLTTKVEEFKPSQPLLNGQETAVGLQQ